MAGTWHWKEGKSDSRKLLYDPGNWGDLFKAAWLTRILPAMNPDQVCDLFAGAATYELSSRTRSRMQIIADDLLSQAMESFVKDAVWPSAATLCRSLLVPSAKVTVCDLDEERQESYRHQTGIAVYEPDDAWVVLSDVTKQHNTDGIRSAVCACLSAETGLLILDPFDVLAVWREVMPVIISAAKKTTVLLYVYNRSAKNEERLRDYRAFCSSMEKELGGISCMRGRIAADGFLPKAHHELWLMGDGVAKQTELAATLEAVTMKLEDALRRASCFSVR